MKYCFQNPCVFIFDLLAFSSDKSIEASFDERLIYYFNWEKTEECTEEVDVQHKYTNNV